MTVIEFFDKTAIENMLSALLCDPQRVIYIGDDRKRMKQAICAYQQVLKGRFLDVELQYKSVNKNDLKCIVDVLSQVVEENEDCVFNLDGGEDLYLVAVGMVAQKYGNRVQLHRFNVRSSIAVDCDADGNNQQVEPISISIEENALIYEGRVIYQDERAGTTQRWVLNAEFCEDVRAMWRICRVKPRQWNWVMGQLDRLRSLFPSEEGSLDVVIPYTPMVKNDFADALPYLRMILTKLAKAGVLKCMHDDERELRFSYKNAQVQNCLGKAGTILELFITVSAKYLVKDDERVYNDALCGVFLDWDGILQGERQADVNNEMDVMLMHGAVPVFISCKNGDMEMVELYKLNTVAERFGGKYAKKVLVISSFDELGPKSEYISLRAKDMNIQIIQDPDRMEEAELERVLASVWSN